MKNGIERKFITFSIISTLSIILVHAIAVLLQKSFFTDTKAVPYQLAAATILTLLFSFFIGSKNQKYKNLVPFLISILIYVLFILFDRSLSGLMLAVVIICPLSVMIGYKIYSSLPSWLDGAVKQYKIISVLWVILALLMITQTTRLSSWLVDPANDWQISTNNPFFAQHMCMTAYIYAADLDRQGEKNIYDQSHYPGLNPKAKPHTTIKNFQPDDPYQYPPQFLIVPRLAIALTNDFDLIKIFWFFLQALLIGFITLSISIYIGGKAGTTAALLIPLLWLSFPVLSNLQYGQFHMVSLLFAVIGMMWFAQEKYFLGGLSLTFAILSKVAPGILLIYLLAKRKWKEAIWTISLSIGISILALIIIGPEPFEAFITYQLPKLQNGSAFSFFKIWPEFKDLLIAGNLSPFALIYKLDALGISGMTLSLAKLTHLLYTLFVIAAAIFAVRIKGDRRTQLLVWLTLLNLAAMISKGAWGDYIPIGTFWLITFLIHDMGSSLWKKVIIMGTGIFMFLSIGSLPLPGLGNPSVFISLSAIGMFIIIGFNIWILYKADQMSKALNTEYGFV